MTNTIFHLFQLQKLDTHRDVLHNRLDAIQDIIKKDTSVITAKQNLSNLDTELSILKGELSGIEDIIKNKRVKIELAEASLYGGSIKNPKELQDIQKEITSIKTNIQSLEDKQLLKLIEIEEKESEVASAGKDFKIVTRKSDELNAELITESNSLNLELQKLHLESIAIIDQISPENYSKYIEMRKRKKGIAISKVEDQCCSVCGTTLTPAECQNAKVPNAFVYCGSCGRILYAG